MAVILKGEDLTLEDVGSECGDEDHSRAVSIIMKNDGSELLAYIWKEGDKITIMTDKDDRHITVNQSLLDKVSWVEFLVSVPD